MAIILPKKEHIYQTGSTDPVNLHYLPLVSYFMNKRLAMALSLLQNERFGQILDAGCGGGISFPELARRCEHLSGIDIHGRLNEVEKMALAEGISVTLKNSSVEKINFGNESFDCVFCLSVLEFVSDLEKAIDELYRVTKRQSVIILGFPVINFLTDISYLLIKIKNARQIHHFTHQDILKAAKRRFILKRTVTFPFFLPQNLGLFICCRLEKS